MKPARLCDITCGQTDARLMAPGDRARGFVGKRGRGWLLEVHHPDPARVEPPCPHYGHCGGCSWQHLSYPAQLAYKAETVHRLLAAESALPPVASPSPWLYRTKVELSFGPCGELGFMRQGRWNQVCPVDGCLIGPPCNQAALQATREWQKRHALPGWDARAQTGLLRWLVLRHSSTTGQWLAVLVAQGEVPAAELAGRLTERGATGVLLARQSSTAGAVKPDSVELLSGQDELIERLGELSFELSWRSFYQANPPAYLRLLQTAREWAGPVERLLDLYCGIGTIGLFLEPNQLTGVESVPEAIENARANALRNQRSGSFEVVAAEEWTDLDCDLLVLDPPRSGCHPKLIKRLAAEGPQTLLYVSCNPARLAEEMRVLGQRYRLERLQCFDFFPQTPHIEALCLLRLKLAG